MATQKITTGLHCRQARPGQELAVADTPGLRLRVYPSGVRSWMYCDRVWAGIPTGLTFRRCSRKVPLSSAVDDSAFDISLFPEGCSVPSRAARGAARPLLWVGPVRVGYCAVVFTPGARARRPPAALGQ